MSFAPDSSGGEYKHGLSVEELPTHKVNTPVAWSGQTGNSSPIYGPNSLQYLMYQSANAYGLDSKPIGSNRPHNNIQPYKTVYRWVRIS